MTSSPEPSLLELICMRKWQEAQDCIESDSKCIYVRVGANRQLAIHEVCKLVTFNIPLPTAEELSDDEGEEDVAELARVQQNERPEQPRQQQQQQQSTEDDNQRLLALAKLMIETSHRLGPVSVEACTLEEEGNVNDNENDNGPDEATYEEGSFQVQAHESILTVRDFFGKTPLHVLCEHSANTEMLRVIFGSTRGHTENPSTPTALTLTSAKDTRGSTPLHYLAYSRQCPFSSLKLMMDYCQPGTTGDENGGTTIIDPTLCTDNDGETPLHWALDGYMSPRRISELIRYSQDAVRVKNLAGRRPFDQFVGNFVDADWRLHDLCGKEVWDNIQAYLKVFFYASEDDQPSTSDRNIETDQGKDQEKEWFPVHFLAGSSIEFPPVFMEIALHFNKDDLSKFDSKGRLPLHLACQRRRLTNGIDKSPNNDVAMKILKEYPQAAYKAEGQRKRLPLHIAITSRMSLRFVSSLLSAYPNSLNIKDPMTGLWPFLLAGSYNDVSVETSYGLLRADPSIVQVAITALISKRGQRAAAARRYMALSSSANAGSSSTTVS